MFEKWSLFVCLLKFVWYCMLVCLCICFCTHLNIYLCLCMYWHAFFHISTYFYCSLVGRSGTKEDWEREEKSWVMGKEIDCCNQNFFFLSNFMVTKGLFWFEYEISVLWERKRNSDCNTQFHPPPYPLFLCPSPSYQ